MNNCYPIFGIFFTSLNHKYLVFGNRVRTRSFFLAYIYRCENYCSQSETDMIEVVGKNHFAPMKKRGEFRNLIKAIMENSEKADKGMRKMSYLIMGGLVILALIIILLIESLM